MDLMRDGRVLVLSGPLDARSTADVRTALYDQLAAYDEGVVLDVTDVEWIDVTALRMLAVATRFADRRGQHLTLRGARPRLLRAVRQSRLRRMLEVERDIAV